MNYAELCIDIKNIRVSLTRNVFIHHDEFKDVQFITYKDYNIPPKTSNDNKVFQISGYFSFPPISSYFSINPMNIYNFYSNKVISDIDKTFNTMQLYPTCASNYLCCNYCLNLEINFCSTLVRNEYLYIPIELYTPLKIIDYVEEEKEEDEEKEDEDNINNEEIKEKENQIINNQNQTEGENIDFEIINRLDFYKVLAEEKN